jgi:hypothetical protein
MQRGHLHAFGGERLAAVKSDQIEDDERLIA